MAILVALIFVLPACGATDKDRPLLVFAAASLENVVTELTERFEERTKVDVDIAFGGSNALAQQILSGAPADLFISAGLPPANLLTESGHADESDLYSIAGNELVIAAAPGRRSFDSAVDLLSGDVGRIALVDPAFAPAGWYTEQALHNAGVWQELLAQDSVCQRRARSACLCGIGERGRWHSLSHRCRDRTHTRRRLHYPHYFTLADRICRSITARLVEWRGRRPPTGIFRLGRFASSLFAIWI